MGGGAGRGGGATKTIGPMSHDIAPAREFTDAPCILPRRVCQRTGEMQTQTVYPEQCAAQC
eukprot:827294-Lingulodinium_polyedra.AAC.1